MHLLICLVLKLSYLIFFILFLLWVSHVPGWALASCCWGWSWITEPPTSTTQVLELEACAMMSSVCSAGDRVHLVWQEALNHCATAPAPTWIFWFSSDQVLGLQKSPRFSGIFTRLAYAILGFEPSTLFMLDKCSINWARFLVLKSDFLKESKNRTKWNELLSGIVVHTCKSSTP